MKGVCGPGMRGFAWDSPWTKSFLRILKEETEEVIDKEFRRKTYLASKPGRNIFCHQGFIWDLKKEFQGSTVDFEDFEKYKKSLSHFALKFNYISSSRYLPTSIGVNIFKLLFTSNTIVRN